MADSKKNRAKNTKDAASSSTVSKNKNAKPTKEDLRSKKLDAIKQKLERQRQEEERLRKEAEEEERRFQEEQRKLEEQKRIEAEKREHRKKKEKERRQRLKDEGKLLTEKEKENRRRAVELAQARGLDLQSMRNNAKKTTYTKLKKKPQAQQQQSRPSFSTEGEKSESPTVEEKAKEEVEEVNSDEEKGWEDLAAELEEIEKQGMIDNVTNNWEEETVQEEEEEVIDDTEVKGEISPSPSTSGDAAAHEPSDKSSSLKASEDQLTEEDKRRLIEEAKVRIAIQQQKLEAPATERVLRSGVICVMGHVDTGKTKILDKLRNTNVQSREAGGITQQIGATNVPRENIIHATSMCDYFKPEDLKMPGLLIIDTPGHESFSNMRIRGSSLCDFAILVVDIMHGIEEQTKESIEILLKRRTPFVVALNKIDRLYQWENYPDICVKEALSKQKDVTMKDFKERFKAVVQDFAMMNLNVELFYKNENPTEYISMVPTSAHSGDGMGDLLAFMCKEMQRRLYKRLTFSEELKASVMEVKEIVGLGTSLDVILVNGRIREGDTIVLAGQEGPIVTTVRGVLMPAPMSELRVKGNYTHLKEVVGSCGVKIIARDLEKALAGFPLYVATDLAERLYYSEEVTHGLKSALTSISVSPVGVYVVASTLGSLESLLTFLRKSNIPYSGISIGTVHKKDVMKASIMVERDNKYAVILAFDVRVDKDAEKMAAEVGVTIFTANIIYHLEASMNEYMQNILQENRKKHADQAVFPVKLRILPDMVFNKRAPIVVGVHIEAGLLREGTPICVPSKNNIVLGRITSIENNHKAVSEARTGQEVCIRIDPIEGEAPKAFRRHFDHTDMLVSKISRESIDVVKEFYRGDLNKEDWKLVMELKKMLAII
ncbi:unnamed protein product [Hymenolepis diminuta]|uniref:Eukaryotic translation initiation factor 5B n=1 Tax=Hymenolepis diminuta TaxID=6216 RepID=A0A0R3SGP3_HYMDI|nr:unnamed protein product [Hymenolepis diminuta]